MSEYTSIDVDLPVTMYVHRIVEITEKWVKMCMSCYNLTEEDIPHMTICSKPGQLDKTLRWKDKTIGVLYVNLTSISGPLKISGHALREREQ